MNDDSIILGLSLMYAAIIVLYAWRKTPPKGRIIGAAKWDAKESWAANLTAVGGILTIVLAAKPILDRFISPERGRQSSDISWPETNLFVLSLFFVALSTTAPFIYNAIGTETRNRLTDKGEVKKDVVASLWVYLVACFMTLWGVSGQLLTLGWVLDDLWGGLTKHKLLSPQLAAFEILLAFAFVLIVPYATKSIRGTIEDNLVKTPPTPPAVKPAGQEHLQPENAPQSAPAPQPRSWSIL